MIKKSMTLLVVVLATTFYVSAQSPPGSPPPLYDTAKTGCLYVVDPMIFKTATGYLERVVGYEFQMLPKGNQTADSVTLVKTKVAKTRSYYLINELKKSWVVVQVIQDFNLDLTLK